jgi:hypothetical protein
MKRRFATSEIDACHVRSGMGFADHASEQFERKEFGVRAIEIFVGTKAVATVKIADVRQLHAQAAWAVVAVEVVRKVSHKKAQKRKS